MRQIQTGSSYLATVAMVALASGTIAGERGIIHVNPDSSQRDQRQPVVSEGDAAKLEKRKLAVRTDREPPEWAVELIKKLDLSRLEADLSPEDEGAEQTELTDGEELERRLQAGRESGGNSTAGEVAAATADPDLAPAAAPAAAPAPTPSPTPAPAPAARQAAAKPAAAPKPKATKGAANKGS